MQFWAYARKAHEQASSSHTDLLNSRKSDEGRRTRRAVNFGGGCWIRRVLRAWNPKFANWYTQLLLYHSTDNIHQNTIRNVLRKLLWLHDYKIQFPHEIKFTDPLSSIKYSNLMFSEIHEVLFKDECILQTTHSACSNLRHNCRNCGVGQPYEVLSRHVTSRNLACGHRCGCVRTFLSATDTIKLNMHVYFPEFNENRLFIFLDSARGWGDLYFFNEPDNLFDLFSESSRIIWQTHRHCRPLLHGS